MANPTVAEISASRAGATGALAYAVLGTALPTDATTALVAAYKGLGYIGEDGIAPARDISTDPVRDMNGDQVYTLQTEFSRTYEATLLQSTNVDVKKAIFGDTNVVVTAPTASTGTKITVQDKGVQAPHVALVATTFDGQKTHRECSADAQITAVEIGPLVGTAVRSYTITYTIYKDSAGVYTYEYDDNGVFTV
jgi:hypothetical protein